MLIQSYIFVSKWKFPPYMLIPSYTGIWYCRVRELPTFAISMVYGKRLGSIWENGSLQFEHEKLLAFPYSLLTQCCNTAMWKYTKEIIKAMMSRKIVKQTTHFGIQILNVMMRRCGSTIGISVKHQRLKLFESHQGNAHVGIMIGEVITIGLSCKSHRSTRMWMGQRPKSHGLVSQIGNHV